ncbi:tropomyosin [Echinococcus multilocularis]|uniref:Tropomyosin n=1 Tax=Echinococcus multilocularis TaxID=6211 RepID=A0A068YHD3_ECHMU|nr:tropomyosin [Echinococcus multilocularis]
MDALKQRILETYDSNVKLEAELAEKDKELRTIIQEQKALEAEVRAAHKNRDTLEIKVEAAQKDLKECLLKLEESQRAADESKKAAANLERKRDAQEELVSELEEKLQRVAEEAKLAQSKSSAAVEQLREIEEKIDQVESLNEKKEKSILELQHLTAFYTNKLKAFKSSSESEAASIDALEKQILEATKLLDAANLRAKGAEEQALLNQMELAMLEDELSEWKDKNSTLQSEIDRINVELQ